MRPSILLAIVTMVLVTPALLAEDGFPKVMKVSDEKAEVRSAPSKDAIPTTRLSRGDEVLVLRAVPGHADWFAIKPPKGSFSWIQGDVIKKIDGRPNMGFVDVDHTQAVKAFAGSHLDNREPEAVSAAVVLGSTVEFIDRPLTLHGKTWYPIAPLPWEVRYVHKSQLGIVATEEKTPRGEPGVDATRLLRQRIEALEKRIEQLEKRQKKKTATLERVQLPTTASNGYSELAANRFAKGVAP